MKTLSPLQIRNRINNLGYVELRRKNTDKENDRIFFMKQVLSGMNAKYVKSFEANGCRLVSTDRF